jgi:hypothetical protein
MSIGVRYTAWQLTGRAARDIRRYAWQRPFRRAVWMLRRTGRYARDVLSQGKGTFLVLREYALGLISGFRSSVRGLLPAGTNPR